MDQIIWSGGAVPTIGEIVECNMNRLGAARVLGYASCDGYLGVLVEFIDPPEWFIRQNGDDRTGVIFGAEIRKELTQ